MNFTRAIELFALLALTTPSLAATTDKIDTYILSEMDNARIPGISIAIVKNGEIIKTKGYGLANIELKAPASVDTVYQSASIGKQFVATLIMMLVEDGTLSLNSKVNQYINGAPKSWEDITIQQLLNHTSGLQRDFDAVVNGRLDYTDDELIKLLGTLPLDAKPGTKWNYSNIGYTLIGIIIKNVSGKFYGDLLQERIFKPLDMNTTRIVSDTDIIPNRAAGYNLVNGELKNPDFVSHSLNQIAAGGLYLTVLDLAKWDKALYTEKLLKKTSLNLMWSPVIINQETYDYGLGWRLNNINGHRVIYHAGWWQGFTGEIHRFIDDKLTIIVLTNLGDKAKMSQITNGIIGLVNPALVPNT